MRRATLTLCYDGHPDSPRHFWVTKDGLKFSQEQWELMKFMERLEKKLDKMATLAPVTSLQDREKLGWS